MTITDWIQAISTLILVGVTAFYAWKTYDLSTDAKRQADASVKMADEMKEQRYDTVRPVIDIELVERSTDLSKRAYSDREQVILNGLRGKLVNRGLGPAMDVQSYIVTESGKEKHNFGVIGKGKEYDPLQLALLSENNFAFVRVEYRDIYGRLLESKREFVQEKSIFPLGPLQTSIIKISEVQ